MDLSDLKLQTLGLVGQKDFGRVLTIVDFGNVTYWYHKDRIGADAAPLKNDQYLIVDKEATPRMGRGLDFGSASGGQGGVLPFIP